MSYLHAIHLCVLVALSSTVCASSEAPRASVVDRNGELVLDEVHSLDDESQINAVSQGDNFANIVLEVPPVHEENASNSSVHERPTFDEGSSVVRESNDIKSDVNYFDKVLLEDGVSDSVVGKLPNVVDKSNSGKNEKLRQSENQFVKTLSNDFFDKWLRSSEETDSGENSNKPEVIVPQASEEKPTETIVEEEDIELQSPKVLSLLGNSYMVSSLARHSASDFFDIAFSFRARLADSILLYIYAPRKHEFLSLMIDASGALILTTSIHQETLSEAAINNDEENGSGAQDTFVDTELDAESGETNIEELREVLLSDVVATAWHSVAISWHVGRGDALNVTLDNGRSTSFKVLSHSLFRPSEVFFGYIPYLREDCNSIEMCRPSATSSTRGPRFQYSTADGTCRAGQHTGFRSEQVCLGTCKISGVSSFNPLSGCLKHVSLNGFDLLGNIPTQHTDVLSIVPRGRRINAPLADTCPQLTSPRPAVSLLHHGAHFQIPPPCKASFTLSLELRPFPPSVHDHTGPAVVASGFLQVLATSPQEYKWKLVLKQEKLHLTVAGLNKSLSSLTTVEKDTWNYIILYSSGKVVAVALNGLRNELSFDGHDVQFVSPITVGDHKNGITGCLNNVEMDSVKFDSRKFMSGETGVLVGQCLDRELCQHGGQVMPEKQSSRCDCSSTAYDGPHCQFLRHPRSCSEYRQLGYVDSGRYVIDVDGRGPVLPFEVRCDFLETATNTTFAHNLPENFVIKGDPNWSRQLRVSYLGGEALRWRLKELASTMQCRQKVDFSCRNFPLRLSANKTLLSYDGQTFTNRLGGSRAGVCPCKEKESCSKSSVVCNCDLGDDDVRSDSVWLTRPEHLPLSGFVIGDRDDDDDDDSELRLTVSNLTCSEPVLPARTISLRHSTSAARLAVSMETSFSFAFKTLQSDAVILKVSSATGRGSNYTLLLRHGTGLVFMYDNTNVAVSNASYPLNSGQWQHVMLEGSEDQIGLTLNGHKTFPEDYNFRSSFSITDIVITFGGGSLGSRANAIPGLIGCIRDVRVDLAPRDFEEEFGTTEGCSELCGLMAEASGQRCNMDNVAEEYELKCAGKLPSVEDDLDSNDGLRFTDSEAEVLFDLTGEDLLHDSYNPLSQDFSFVFRTRERSALLLFVFDSSQNVLQIHMEDPTLLYVYFNSEFDMQRIIVNTRGKRMNKGSPVQVSLERGEDHVSVGVSIDGCWFNSSLELSMSYIRPEDYRQFPFERPPHLTDIPHSKTVPSEYLSIHLGGAMTGGATSSLPNLIGCITAVSIGRHPNAVRDLAKWNKTAGGVVQGCVDTNAGCGEDVCRNGGTCLATFTEERVHPSCDCSRTSYRGVDCTAETCYKFEDKNFLHFEVPEGSSDDFELDFAFAVEKKSGRLQPEQTIVEVESWTESGIVEINIRVTNASSLEVSLVRTRSYEWTLPAWALRADILQGQRHQLLLTYRHPTLNFYFNGRHIHLGRPSVHRRSPKYEGISTPVERFIALDIRNSVPTPAYGFILCISNLRVKYGNDTYDIFDLHEADQLTLTSPKNILRAVPSEGCSTPATEMYIGAPRLPHAAVGASAHMSEAPALVPYGNETSTDSTHEEDTENSSLVLIIVICVISLLLLVIIVVLVLYIRKIHAKHRENANPRMQIIRTYSRTSESRNSMRSNVGFEQELIPLRYANDTNAQASEGIRYVTEEESYLNGDASKTRPLSLDSPLEPLMATSLSDEIHGHLSTVPEENFVATENGCQLPESRQSVQFRGLSMANDMLYETAQRQKQIQQLEGGQEDIDGETRVASSQNEAVENDEAVEETHEEEVGDSNNKNKDSNPYEEYDFKEEIKKNDEATKMQNQRDEQAPQVSSDEPNVQLDETNQPKVSSGDGKLAETPADENPTGSKNNQPTTLQDDNAAGIEVGKGRLVQYSGLSAQPSITNNPLYETAPQVERRDQQVSNPECQEENYAKSSLLETSFTEDGPETVRHEVSLSDSDQVQPEQKDEDEVAKKDKKDESEDLGSSADELDDYLSQNDDDWFTRRHLVISLSTPIEPSVQVARIISKQPSKL